MPAPAHSRLGKFLDHLRIERRLSPHTCVSYRRDLERLQVFCRAQGLSGWEKLTPAHVRAYIARLHKQGLSGTSLQRQLSAVRAFYRFLSREQNVRANPALGVPAPKSPRRLPRTLTADQAVKLVSHEDEGVLGRRDRAILELLYSSGLRLSELVALDLTDLDIAEGVVRVTGKGAKERLVPVGRHACAAIRDWLTARAGLARHGEPALFVTHNGARLGGRSIQRRLRTRARRLGISVPVHPHLLRHSFASHLLESSGDLRAVQELLGHANISTTQVYTHLDFQHLAKVYDQAHPRARKKAL
jgi:integrase/recombinase XerC